VRADVRLLPFEDGAFSWAVASHVLEFTGEPAAVLAEARRALRPGGRLLVLVSDEPRSVTIPLRPLARRTDRLGGRAFHLGRAGLESAAREAGLSVVSSGGCGHLAAALGAAAHALLSLVHGGAADRLLAALLALDDGLAAAAGGGLDAWAVLERPRQGYERGLMR
jgi:SAM-dependent methyltransferase